MKLHYYIEFLAMALFAAGMLCVIIAFPCSSVFLLNTGFSLLAVCLLIISFCI